MPYHYVNLGCVRTTLHALIVSKISSLDPKKTVVLAWAYGWCVYAIGQTAHWHTCTQTNTHSTLHKKIKDLTCIWVLAQPILEKSLTIRYPHTSNKKHNIYHYIYIYNFVCTISHRSLDLSLFHHSSMWCGTCGQKKMPFSEDQKWCSIQWPCFFSVYICALIFVSYYIFYVKN